MQLFLTAIKISFYKEFTEQRSFSKRGSFVVDLLFGVVPVGCRGSVFVFVLLCIALCPF